MRHGIGPEAAVELAGTLSRIASVLERLDSKLAERPAGEPIRDSSPVPASPGSLLQEGIREVLAEIARVKRDSESRISRLDGRPLTDEQRELEHTAFVALSTLRRRQADLLYRLQTQAGSNGASIDALASL